MHPVPGEPGCFLAYGGAARHALYRELASVPGCLVEDKGISVAVHYRQVSSAHRPGVFQLVSKVARSVRLLRLQPGHDVLELRPNVAWDKGQAVIWLLEITQGGNWWERVPPHLRG
ncbi:MAG: trehalose-phosphatase [Bacillota bacterium]|nr:trehalose-phosphatase [Bacillota bacterium]